MKKRSEFIDHLVRLRKDKVLSQAKLAKKLGLSRTAVSGWELGTSKPPPESRIKLGNLTEGEESIWFWGKAGISDDAMAKVVNKRAAESVVRPRKGQVVRVRPLREAKETEEDRPDLLLPGELFPRPFLTRYLIVDEESRGYGFEIGDFLLVDISDRESLNLLPFWNRRVLCEFDSEEIAWPGGVSRGGREQIVGRLILEGWSTSPAGYSWAALLQPWNDELVNVFHRAEDRTERAGANLVGRLEFQAPSQPEAEGKGHQTGLNPLEALRREAAAHLQLNSNCRILGRVVGWIEGPREKK